MQIYEFSNCSPDLKKVHLRKQDTEFLNKSHIRRKSE